MKILKSNYSLKRWLRRAAALLFVLAFLGKVQISPAFAFEKATGANDTSINSLEKSIDTGELEQFINETFKREMQDFNIPGAVISVVKDGKLILSKGFGYADLENKTPVAPEKTKFRIASITKLFTANSVMQLVENNKIDLDQDVNSYLKGFKIKNPYPGKVTMSQLLTHTSGIDSDVIGDLSEKESDVQPVSQFLKNRMLPVVREPGRFIQYSNYGMALAGCIVEEVSGMSCADYIHKNIFNPLEMKNTGFALNPPELARGYMPMDGTLKRQELKGYFNLYPVGGIVSTADDMAKFMIAHLNNGEYNNRRILKKTTAIEMHSRRAGFDAVLPGICYGFAEGFRNGQRTIGHAGYSPDGFLSELCLFPEHNMGIFISINQGANNSFPQDFVKEFTDHYFPVSRNKMEKSVLNEAPDKKIEGTYRFGEYTRTTLNKGDLFGVGEDVKVTVNADRTITLDETDPFTGKKTVINAKQVKPMIFKNSDGEYFVFKLDDKGEVAYMAQTSNSWHGTYERISWYDENSFQISLFVVCCVLFLLEVLLYIVFTIRHLIFKRKGIAKVSGTVRCLNFLVAINSMLNLLFYGISMITWGSRLRYGVPIDVKLLLLIPVVSCLITAALSVGSIIAWKKKEGSLFFRINTSLVTIAGVIFVWFYQYWNLLGFKY